MKFGAVPVDTAEGAIAVHSIRQSGLVLKKGTRIGKSEIAALEAAGIPEIVVARLEPGDVSEDVAAAEIAAALVSEASGQRGHVMGARAGHSPEPGSSARAAALAGEGVRIDRAFTGRANLLQAGGRRRDDRDREDHSVRGGETSP